MSPIYLSSKNKNEIRAIACNVLFKPTECPLRLDDIGRDQFEGKCGNTLPNTIFPYFV